jgi:hypothetical protein
MSVFEQLVASIAVERALLRCDREPVDVATRQLVAAAAKLLRDTSPSDGQIEILLHELARTLEMVAALGSKRELRGLGEDPADPKWRDPVPARA